MTKWIFLMVCINTSGSIVTMGAPRQRPPDTLINAQEQCLRQLLILRNYMQSIYRHTADEESALDEKQQFTAISLADVEALADRIIRNHLLVETLIDLHARNNGGTLTLTPQEAEICIPALVNSINYEREKISKTLVRMQAATDKGFCTIQ